MNEKEKPIGFEGKKILLIDGGSRQVLPLIKGFHDLKCNVSVYCGSKFDVGYVYKYTDKRILGIVDFHDEDKTYSSMKEIISSGDYDVVIPMIDFFASILSKHKEELSQFATIYVNDWNIYFKAIDKLQTMQVCMDEDIPCPKTSLDTSIENLDVSSWTYPIVVKPRTSWGAKGFNIVKSKDELIDIVSLTEKKFGPCLIQEYIPQTGKQYQVEMAVDKNGVCKAFVLMEKVRWYPLNGGSSTMNVTIHDEEVKNNCIKLLNSLKWRGYASLDLIMDPRDGVIKVMEINPRMNGTAKICFYAGVNLSRLILEDAFDKEVTDQTDYAEGVGLRYFHMDVLWFIKSKNRFRAKPSWFSWKNTVDEIFELDDIRPGLVYSVVAVKKLFEDRKNRNIKQ